MALVEILTEQQRKKRVWKRVFNLLLAISIIFVGFYLYVVEQQYQTDKWHAWVNNEGQQLTSQYNSMLASAVADKDEQLISQILHNIGLQPAVIEVVLFSADGQPMNTEQWLPGQHLLLQNREKWPQIYVQELWSENTLIGYLRVALNRQQLLTDLVPVIQATYRPFVLAGILLLILGVIIGRKFTLWQYKNR